MGNADSLIDNWAEEAMGDLGSKGWRDIDTNSLLLIIYAAQKADGRKHAQKITKPFWWLLAVISPGVLWYISSGFLGI